MGRLDWDRDVVEQASSAAPTRCTTPPSSTPTAPATKPTPASSSSTPSPWWRSTRRFPRGNRPCEDPREGELAAKYPLVYIQYHDRLNVHTQHILNPALEVVQDEPLLQMNPVDAEARGIAHGDVVRVLNDRGDMKIRAFLTEDIIPGTVATQSGWTPDYFIARLYQICHHTSATPKKPTA